MDLPPARYYEEFLHRTLVGLPALAGAIWLKAPAGKLYLQQQINETQDSLDQDDAGRLAHHDVLRCALISGRPVHLPPNGMMSGVVNPTEKALLLAPISADGHPVGLIQVWQEAGRNPSAVPGDLQVLAALAAMAGLYLRHQDFCRQAARREFLERLDDFARKVHGSLEPAEVARRIADAGQPLIGCDRVAVGLVHDRHVRIEALSGAAVFDPQSRLLGCMGILMERVLAGGERLAYPGFSDQPPAAGAREALAAYLAESAAKFVCILPLNDRSEGTPPGGAALLAEWFVGPAEGFDLLELVVGHAASAINNARRCARAEWRPWGWLTSRGALNPTIAAVSAAFRAKRLPDP
jgi:hypothetical protein